MALKAPKPSVVAVVAFALLSKVKVIVLFALNPEPFMTTRSPGFTEPGVTVMDDGTLIDLLREDVAFATALPIMPPAAVVAFAIALPAEAAAFPASVVALCAEVVAFCLASAMVAFAEGFEVSPAVLFFCAAALFAVDTRADSELSIASPTSTEIIAIGSGGERFLLFPSNICSFIH